MKHHSKVFFQGFKEFITKGSVLDLAIAFIIGAAFRDIVSSLVNDIIMPLITTLTGKVNFAELIWIVNSAEIRYGMFIQNIVEFLIIAFSIYAAISLVIKREAYLAKVEAAKNPKPEEPKVEVIPQDILLLTEIRDLLKTKDNPQQGDKS